MEKIVKDTEDDMYPSGKLIDISSEEYRLYRYSKGENVTIRHPMTLYIDSKGDHRIVDEEGQNHTVKKGWMHMKFTLRDGASPELLLEDEK